jgi:signal transduction histidine kinase
MLVFTVVFAYLLIEENIYDYERALQKQQALVSGMTHKDSIEDSEKILKTILIKNTLAIATLAFILFSIMLMFHKIFNILLQRDIERFLEFFKKTAHSGEMLNPRNIFFKDFKLMVGHANEMVSTISEQKNSLIELNQGLEDRVRQKTADLRETNKNLIEEKKFSEDLLKSQKEFLRYTIHETNTPLSIILTSIELLEMENKKDRQLSKIEAAVKNIFNIYDDLSYLVKKDKVTYPKKVIDLDNYVESRIDFFREVAELSKLKFDYKHDEKHYHVYFNETKLQRIVDNTLTNAIKYTQVNEVIEIGLKYFGSFVDIEVSSKSKIIKDVDKIFDAYYREEEKQEGFGIGLRLVKSICDEEGVEILLDSTPEKTTFTYRFKMMGE